jgi:hypothetical protein
LKIVFGLLDQSGGADNVAVESHTAITVAWPTAKSMAYYLVANVFAQQAQAGLIALQPNAVPPRPNSAEPAWAVLDRKVVAYFAWIHDQFFSASAYVPPSVEQAESGPAQPPPSPPTTP